MKALHYGAGSIGRGFIGKVLFEAGLDVVLADVVPGLIHELRKRKEFIVHVVGENQHDDIVRIHDAVISDTPEVLDVIGEADLITTAVGPRILSKVAPSLAKGLLKRREKGLERPCNIIACENALQASSILKTFVMQEMTVDDKNWIEAHVGFVDCAVDCIVPPTKHSDPLEVTVEDFSEWIVDRNQFVGPPPEQIKGMIFSDKLMAFVERKLMTVNTGHAICAYLGKLYGHDEIRTAIQDPRIRPIVEGAMRESGAVLTKKYHLEVKEHEAYIHKNLKRYANPHIRDEVTRVGREPIRKLSPDDRLIKPLKGALEFGLPHTNLAKGVAAALLYCNPADEQAVKLQKTVESLGWEGTLSTISNLTSTQQELVAPEIRKAVTDFRAPLHKDSHTTVVRWTHSGDKIENGFLFEYFISE